MLFPKAYSEAGNRPKRSIVGTMIADDPAVEIEKSPETTNALDLSWLPFAAKTYCISPRIEDYILKPMPLCPSDIPNRNGIAFPIQELVKFHPPPIARQSFKAWTGTPAHLEHDNEDHTKAYGVVLDTFLRPIVGYGNGQHFNVMGLVAIDKVKNPDIAQEVLDGRINTGSMGALADYFTCSVCGQEATDNPMMNCAHIRSTKQVNWNLVTVAGVQHIACLNAHNISPIEFSMVRDPAWCTALSDHSNNFSW